MNIYTYWSTHVTAKHEIVVAGIACLMNFHELSPEPHLYRIPYCTIHKFLHHFQVVGCGKLPPLWCAAISRCATLRHNYEASTGMDMGLQIVHLQNNSRYVYITFVVQSSYEISIHFLTLYKWTWTWKQRCEINLTDFCIQTSQHWEYCKQGEQMTSSMTILSSFWPLYENWFSNILTT